MPEPELSADDTERTALLRALPQLGALMESERGRALAAEFGAGLARGCVRDMLARLRADILAGERPPVDSGDLLARAGAQLRIFAEPRAREVINASGVLLHTGLGRAALPDAAVAALEGAARYTTLQTDIVTGKRSLREERIEWMLRELTGAEAATVVNNNAAATMLVLNTLCAGREAVISRGQLIEIGGEFRMPEVMAMSNAAMREVGATNRTHLRDYERAIGESTAALVHVHTSNYRVRGFAGTPGIAEISALAKKHNVYSFDDLGSGALAPLGEWGLPDEPLVVDSLRAGADVVCFSGDKLIGGPQCGIICGKAGHIARIRKNPFARMFRVCKLTLAALEATLGIWLNGDFRARIPFYRMLETTPAELLARADIVAGSVRELFSCEVAMQPSRAYVGSGSIPDETVESLAVRISPKRVNCNALAAALRGAGIFAHIAGGAVLLEMRTLLPGQEVELAARLPVVLERFDERD